MTAAANPGRGCVDEVRKSASEMYAELARGISMCIYVFANMFLCMQIIDGAFRGTYVCVCANARRLCTSVMFRVDGDDVMIDGDVY